MIVRSMLAVGVLLVVASAAFCADGTNSTSADNSLWNEGPNAPIIAAEWGGYRDTIRTRLESSSNPRDWAVSAAAFSLEFASEAPAGRPERTRLLSRALDAAPDDALVQWMGVIASRYYNDDGLKAQALRHLRTADADNAAVWFESLATAAQARDRAGVSAALARMAQSSVFTNRIAEARDAVLHAYQLEPIPQDLFDRIAVLCPDCSAKAKPDIPLIMATAVTNGGLPAFQSLVTACTIDTHGKNADRTEDCRKIGRLLATTGDSIIASRIGFTVLRVSRSFDDSDIALCRQDDWIAYHTRRDLRAPEDADNALRYHTDWLQTGSELGAMRKAAERANLAPTPPADWNDATSLFTPERIRADEQRTVALDY